MGTYEICTYLASDFIATFVLTPDGRETTACPDALVSHPLIEWHIRPGSAGFVAGRVLTPFPHEKAAD